MTKHLSGALIALFVFTVPALAAPIPGAIERYTYTYVTPSGPGFSSSSFVYNNTINFDAVAGQRTETLNFQSVATGINIYGQGGTSVSPPNPPDHTPSQVETFTSPGGSGQGYGFDYNGLAAGTAGLSFLTYGVVGGREALTFTGGGTNLLDDGGRFVSSVVIKGDWSNAGSHTTATFNSDYSVDLDFTYDSIGNLTTFTIEDDSYIADGLHNPGIAFSLLGERVKAVPEPITLSLFGAGLAGAAALRRRKKAKTA